MFWRNKSQQDQLGVRLSDLQLMLSKTSIDVSVKGNTLVAKQESMTATLTVDSPVEKETENGPIRAVIRLTTELPAQIQRVFQKTDAFVGEVAG